MDIQQPLRQALAGKTIIESPIFLVLLPNEVGSYQILEATEMKSRGSYPTPAQQQQQQRQHQQHQQPGEQGLLPAATGRQSDVHLPMPPQLPPQRELQPVKGSSQEAAVADHSQSQHAQLQPQHVQLQPQQHPDINTISNNRTSDADEDADLSQLTSAGEADAMPDQHAAPPDSHGLATIPTPKPSQIAECGGKAASDQSAAGCDTRGAREVPDLNPASTKRPRGNDFIRAPTTTPGSADVAVGTSGIPNAALEADKALSMQPAGATAAQPMPKYYYFDGNLSDDDDADLLAGLEG